MSSCAGSELDPIPNWVVGLGVGVLALLAVVGIVLTIVISRRPFKRVVHVQGEPEWRGDPNAAV